MDDDVGGLDAVSLHLQVYQFQRRQNALSGPHHVHGGDAGAAQVFSQHEGYLGFNVRRGQIPDGYLSVVGIDAGAEYVAIAGFVDAQVVAGRLGSKRNLVARYGFGGLQLAEEMVLRVIGISLRESLG